MYSTIAPAIPGAKLPRCAGWGDRRSGSTHLAGTRWATPASEAPSASPKEAECVPALGWEEAGWAWPNRSASLPRPDKSRVAQHGSGRRIRSRAASQDCRS